MSDAFESGNGITIALSKGRILRDTLPLLDRIGIRPGEDIDSTRRLVVPTNRHDVRLLMVRTSDVPTYVEYGAADLGVVGKDVLLEHDGDGVYEPVDLGIARCRLVVAGPGRGVPRRGRLRVASKYVHTARRHFAAKGRQVEVIKLYGSIELGPIVGLADLIVDLVDTGNTLRANGLTPFEDVARISARLIANKAALKTKNRPMREIIEAIRETVETAGKGETA